MIDPFELSVDLKKVAAGLGISIERASKILMDGRTRGLIAEAQICSLDDYEKAPSENSPYDVVYQECEKLEVRSLTKGVSFLPSKNIGYGRGFKQDDWDEKCNGVAGWLVIGNPTIADDGFTASMRAYFISTSIIRKWEAMGILKSKKRMSRTKLLKLLKVEGLA